MIQHTHYQSKAWTHRLMRSSPLHTMLKDFVNLLPSQIRKKDQINIETKNKTVRFIGELAKFKMFSKTDTLHCLKVGPQKNSQSNRTDRGG